MAPWIRSNSSTGQLTGHVPFFRSTKRSCTYGIDLDNRMYDEQLLLARSRIDRLLDNVTSSVDLLTTLSSSFKVVRNQTSGFGSRSQEILSGQRKFQRLADDIDENVRYYEYLEPITRKLNAPGAGQLVGEKEFSDILSHLDACILYMEEHVSCPFHITRPKLADLGE